MDLNFHHLRYFWAVAHEGNLTRAAEKLRVSQSALSVQIRQLEEQLGHALFERRGRVLVLTEAGRIALDHADAIFATGAELVGTLAADAARGARRVLRVGALATLSRNFQLAFLEPLLGRDDVELVLRSGSLGDMLKSLEAHGLDVVLSNTLPARDAASPWTPHALGEQPVSLVGARRGRTKRALRDVLAEEPVVVPTLASSIRTGFDALTERLGVRPRIVAEVDDMAMLRLLARANPRAVAVVPPIVVKDELAEGALVELERLPGLVEAFHAITPSRRFPNPLVGELLARGTRRGRRARTGGGRAR